MIYVVPIERLSRVSLTELKSEIEAALGYLIQLSLIYTTLEIEGVDSQDEALVTAVIDSALADPVVEPEIPTTQVIASGLDIRSLDASTDSVRIDGGSLTVVGEVSLSPSSLAALENIDVTTQDDVTVDIDMIGGSPVSKGIGASDVGTIRVVLSSDNPIVATSATQSGNWEFRQVLTADPDTSAFMISSGALAASILVKNSSGILYRIIGYNNSSSAQYLHIFNVGSGPADGTAPTVVIKIAASSNFELDFGPNGVYMSAGIFVCNSTTLPTKTIGAADCWITAIYK